MKREPVPPPLVLSDSQQSKLRLYRRLWLARIDLEETRETIDELIRRKLPLPRRNRPSPLLQALTTALVVNYARPFVNSRGQSLAEKTVPGSCLRVLTSDERKSHEALIEIRNRQVAHSDADILDITIEVFPDGDGGVCRVVRSPFRQAELRQLRRIVSKLESEIERSCEELRGYLPHHVWL
jgi:hypothetical protein